ncbi:hypothetical protein QR680_012920 [Steinernema hermaphroditum]|uniref:GRIP domain-containing protein n=1 Tax=Steinernema hermaphroditum TaxID=289476 RepID=A0AA39I634_9BILA|nr:hypothetical protein QR680_012920 [Steinernema hermaphroditum]
MFKGLKSKLGDEAKRLQANLTQYGENLANQVRSTASDTGSDISAHTRRFFQPVVPESNTAEGDAKPELSNELIISLDDENDVADNTMSSAVMESATEGDLLGLNESTPRRQRHLSSDSAESTESSLNTFFGNPVVPTSFEPMDTIASDVESTWNDSDSVSANSSSLAGASKEQISSVLSKLHGRAANYKDRYRELVKMYNEIVKENKKCRTVLTTSQDKALAKIERLRAEKKQLAEQLKAEAAEKGKLASTPSEDATKVHRLQELLEKCKESISSNKEKIAQLSAEKERLQAKLSGANDDNDMTQLAVERVTAEWKGRVDRLEEEWTKRLNDVEEKATITIATSKAEMHAALQHKDSDIETWMNKCHQLEKADVDFNVRWQTKVNSLERQLSALEAEKADMVEKLSQAKLEGAVREEEMKLRQQLRAEFERTRKADAEAASEKLESEIRRVEEEWRQKLKDQEEQMQLAIEEREMVKVAALTEQDRKNDEMEIINAQLNEEKIKLQTQLEEIREKNRRQMQELSSSIEANSARHKEELEKLNDSHQEVVGRMKSTIDAKQSEINELEESIVSAKQIADGLRFSGEHSAKKVAELERLLSEKTSTQLSLQEKLLAAEKGCEVLKKNVKDGEEALKYQRKLMEDELKETMKADAEASSQKLESEIRRVEEEWRQKLKDQEEQMQLAIDEREMVKVAALTEQDRKNDEIEIINTQLNEEKIKLQTQLEEILEKNGREILKLTSSIESNSAHHKEELARLNDTHKEVVSKMKSTIDAKQAEISELEESIMSTKQINNELRSSGEHSAKKVTELECLLSEKTSTQLSLQEKLLAAEKECEALKKIVDDREEAFKEQRNLMEDELKAAKEESDRRVDEFKTKAEKKIGKMKRQCETDIHTAKAELLLELDEKRSELTSKQEEVDSLKLSLSSLEAQRSEMNQLKEENSELYKRLKEEENCRERFGTLEQEMNGVQQRLQDKELELSYMKAEKENVKAELVVLQARLRDVEEEKNIEIKKAQSKADTDRQRMVRDLQKEIKQLYQDLNEKTAALDAANVRIQEMEENCTEKVESAERALRHSSIEDALTHEAVDQEELQSMRDRLCQYQKEMAELREKLSREANKGVTNDGRKSPYNGATTTAVMDMHNMNRHASTVSVNNYSDPNLSFAEPTEAEYLRNVLYRYMNERETLGKEIVTLTKVIGTVAKFSKDQLDSVVRKEEARNQGWYGGTVHTVQSVIGHATSNHGP